jgi:hypothetical protein
MVPYLQKPSIVWSWRILTKHTRGQVVQIAKCFRRKESEHTIQCAKDYTNVMTLAFLPEMSSIRSIVSMVFIFYQPRSNTRLEKDHVGGIGENPIDKSIINCRMWLGCCRIGTGKKPCLPSIHQFIELTVITPRI